MDSDSAYGRVTDRERFATLHASVEELVSELERHYEFEVRPTVPEGAHLLHGVMSAQQLVPANAGASVTITLTRFPGLSVRFGARYVEVFPQCGCDACDEQPADLIEDLRRKLTSVAEGGFRETSRGHEFVYGDGWESGSDPERPAADEIDYEAWPRRVVGWERLSRTRGSRTRDWVRKPA